MAKPSQQQQPGVSEVRAPPPVTLPHKSDPAGIAAPRHERALPPRRPNAAIPAGSVRLSPEPGVSQAQPPAAVARMASPFSTVLETIKSQIAAPHHPRGRPDGNAIPATAAGVKRGTSSTPGILLSDPIRTPPECCDPSEIGSFIAEILRNRGKL